MAWYWLDRPISQHQRGKSRARRILRPMKTAQFPMVDPPLPRCPTPLQKLMARSGLSATTREVNVGVEFPISCYPFFFILLPPFCPVAPPSPSIGEAFRVDAIKCHKMKCPTMKANDGERWCGGAKRTSGNEQPGQSRCGRR